VRLDPLGRESADEMLAAILGEGKELMALKRLIIDKTEGNPLFMEEIVQALFEDGALVRNGEIKVTRSLSGIQIPTTVQAILAARIDRLPPDQKDLLQTLAVIGKEFAVRLVGNVTGKSDDELNRTLADLQSAEFIYEQPAMGDVEYGFKHALTQEVAYNSMLTERRKALHERAGAAIETQFTNQLEDHYSELARHYGRSTNREKAFEYARLAGKKALARYAYEEAIGHLRAALALLGQQPSERSRDELDIQLALGEALAVTRGRGAPETGAAFSRARALCSTTEAPAATTFEALTGIVLNLHDQGQLPLALEVAEQLLALAERSGEAGLIGRANWAVGFVQINSASAKARIFFERALSSGANLSRSWTTMNLSHLSLCLQRIGYLDLALRTTRQAEEAMMSGGIEPWALVASHNNAAVFYSFVGDGGSSLRHADAAEALAEKFGFGEYASFARSARAFALALLGRADQTRSLIKAFAQSRPSQSRRMQISYLLNLCMACDEGGLIDDGLRLVETFQALAVGPGIPGVLLSAVLWLKGRLLRKCDPPDLKIAEDCLRRSFESFRKTEDRYSTLMPATDLARVLRDTGRREEARAMLAEIYNWFTGGLDTRYLKEAKALLDELGRQ
jgi:tetratricopeptide (TPR) repeat protein